MADLFLLADIVESESSNIDHAVNLHKHVIQRYTIIMDNNLRRLYRGHD